MPAHPPPPAKPRKRYPSDLTDREWDRIKSLVPAPKDKGFGQSHRYERREILNGILYVTKEGCGWASAPHDLPKHGSLYYYFSLWKRDGTWARIHDTLRGDVREAAGRDREPSAAIVDSQSAKTTEKGGPAVTMRARKSRVASATSSSIPSASSSRSASTPRTSRTATARNSSSNTSKDRHRA